MTALPDQFEELADLVWALVNDRLDAAGADRLQQLLDADAANRRLYIELMDQFASLEWEKSEGGRRRAEGEQRGMGGSPPIAVGSNEGSEFRVQGSGPIAGVFTEPSPPSPFPLPPSALSSLSSTLPSFVGGALFSYLMATVIMGTALAVAWAWKLPSDRQIAWQSAIAAGRSSREVNVSRRRSSSAGSPGWSTASGSRVQGSGSGRQRR